MAQSHLGQKDSKIQSQTTNWVLSYNPSYAGGIGRRIMVQGQPWAKM
jgi:hypothetical protein